MLKIMVADDEPKIRRGIKNAIDWNEIGFEFVGEAEDGQEALAVAWECRPDVLLVDINMPIVNGLEFAQRLMRDLPKSLVIIITGYDEFGYAQKALKLGVFDYLLKPVAEEELHEVLLRARERLEAMEEKDKAVGWAHRQVYRNLPFLRGRFLEEWLQERLSEDEVHEQLDFLQMRFDEISGMIVLKKTEGVKPGVPYAEWNRDLLFFAIRNIVEDLMGGEEKAFSCRDAKDHLVFLYYAGDAARWKELPGLIVEALDKYLKIGVTLSAVSLTLAKDNVARRIPEAYAEALDDLSMSAAGTPIVLLAKAFIDANYADENLSLKDVAEEVRISPSYLSRLLRQELGVTFNDYVTQIRVKHAVWFLQDPTMKIYEIASRTGYSNQHYFSTAFKRVFGISPIEYRKGLHR